jgi:uncharacterized protein YraI
MVVESPLQVEEDIADGEQVSVTSHLLNVRAGAGMEHPVRTQVPRGSVLVVRGYASGWLYVELHDGSYGWVMSRFTTPLATALPGASG